MATLCDKLVRLHEKTWIWLRKGNLKRETEFLFIGEQNNVIRINYIKGSITLKLKCMINNRIANVSYDEVKMKH